MNKQTAKLSAAEWIARLTDMPELSHAEKCAFADFLRESPVHVSQLIEHTFIHADLKALSVGQRQMDDWIAQARAQIGDVVPFYPARAAGERYPPEGRLTRVVRGYFRPRVLVAAAVFVAFGIGGSLLYARQGLYTTGFGEQLVLTLSDGSVASLNTDSQMKVDFTDHARSIVLLKGEALFRVKHDPGRPFLVTADNVLVRAVGTQFDMKIGASDTVVSMIDGVVKIALKSDAPAAATTGLVPITVSRGEEFRVDHRPAGNSVSPRFSKVATPLALRAASWAQGRLEFEDAPLAEVLAEFQRYRRFTVQIDSDATRQMKLTGSFESQDPESVLDYIATIPGLAVEKSGPDSFFIHSH